MKGIILAGGGALLMGLQERLRDETGMKVWLAADPLHSVVLGAGRALEEIDRFGTMIFGTDSD